MSLRAATTNRVTTGNDDEGSRLVPLAVLALMLLLAGLGWWLLQRFSEASKIQDCVMSGRKNCAPIDPDSIGK